ncbi:hypothetical protein NDU88_005918 [Pleurodeles waltl]|uniref:Uncharacterized protein n=1 Tax=Pleurodeles waltl TaxID=8319 RepID=A0AAV7VLG2_PLEWA|nr:hypothetical protein NDU88_005918 [Pleurodeles waltl]
MERCEPESDQSGVGLEVSPALRSGARTELSRPRVAEKRYQVVRLANRRHTSGRAALSTLALGAHGSVRSLAEAVNHRI